MAHWTLDLNKYAKKQKVAIKEVRKAYTFALYSSIAKNTPVGNPDFDEDTGRARGNWQITSNAPAQGEIKDRRAKQKVPDISGDESLFITNNVPYITVLEYGGYPKSPKKGSRTKKSIKPARYEILSQGGFSKKAPAGMVGVTLANNENIFNAAVRAVKGKVR